MSLKAIIPVKWGPVPGLWSWIERIVFIADAREVEPVWRANRAAGSAITGFKRGANIIWRPRARADTFKRADKASDLIVQERPRAHVKMHFRPVHPFDSGNRQPVESLHRAVRLTDRRAEGGEIMPAKQMVGSGLHRVGIKIVVHPPDQTF